MTLDVDRAVRLNERWSQQLGWGNYRERIAKYLGARADDRTFAKLVCDWQIQRPPTSADGILGPATWGQMRTKLADLVFWPFGGRRS